MKYNFLTYLLSFGRIKGKHNKLTVIIKGIKLPLIVNFAKIKVKGDNNTITITYDKFKLKYLFFPRGLDTLINGKNCSLKLDSPPRIINSEIHLFSEDSEIYIKATRQKIEGAKFWITTGSKLYVGENSQMGNGGLKIVAVNNYERKSKVIIGDNFMAAQNCLMRTSD